MFITGTFSLESNISAEKKKNFKPNCWYDASNTAMSPFIFYFFFSSAEFFNSGKLDVRSFNGRLVKVIH